MKVELSDSEMICIMFWYAGFKANTIIQPVDIELHDKLHELFIANCKKVSLKDCGISGMPRYQPGGEHDVKKRIRTEAEGREP